MAPDGQTDEKWFAEKKSAIETSQKETGKALALFQKTVEVLPRLWTQLSEATKQATQLKAELSDAGNRAVTAVDEAGKAWRASLAKQSDELLEKAKQALEAAGASLAKGINQLNRRLNDHQGQVEDLSRKLEAGVNDLKQDDAAIRGTTAALHGESKRQARFAEWYAAAGWWTRLFGRPPA